MTYIRLLHGSILLLLLLFVFVIVVVVGGGSGGGCGGGGGSGGGGGGQSVSSNTPWPLDKREYWNIIFLISQPKHMLWVLKRPVSMRRFF